MLKELCKRCLGKQSCLWAKSLLKFTADCCDLKNICVLVLPDLVHSTGRTGQSCPRGSMSSQQSTCLCPALAADLVCQYMSLVTSSIIVNRHCGFIINCEASPVLGFFVLLVVWRTAFSINWWECPGHAMGCCYTFINSYRYIIKWNSDL